MNDTAKTIIMLFVFICIVIGIAYLAEQPYYKYKIEVTFCDNRPKTIYGFYSNEKIFIRNDYAVTELHPLGLLNVCDFSILDKVPSVKNYLH